MGAAPVQQRRVAALCISARPSQADFIKDFRAVGARWLGREGYPPACRRPKNHVNSERYHWGV
jgi:hypothetical protein